MNKQELEKMVEEAFVEYAKGLDGSFRNAFKAGAALIISGPLAEAEKKLESQNEINRILANHNHDYSIKLSESEKRINELECMINATKYQLESQLAEAQKEIERFRSIGRIAIESGREINASIQSRLAEAQKDTRRLEWMISRSRLAVWDNGRMSTLNHCSAPREVIDAAMKEQDGKA